MERVHSLDRQTNVRLRVCVYRGAKGDHPLEWYCVAAKEFEALLKADWHRLFV